MIIERDYLQTKLQKLSEDSPCSQREVGKQTRSNNSGEAQQRRALQAQQYRLLYTALGGQAADAWTRQCWLQI